MPDRINRVARFVFGVGAAFMPIAFAAAVLIALRTRWISDALWWHSQWHTPPSSIQEVGVGTSRQGLILSRRVERYDGSFADLKPDMYEALLQRERVRAGWHYLRQPVFDSTGTTFGFRVDHSVDSPMSTKRGRVGREEWVVWLPHWFLLMATGAANLVIVVRWRSRRLAARRAVGGLCLACGYDLRATPARCPECGADVPAASH